MTQEMKSSAPPKPWYKHWLAIAIMIFTFPIALPLFGMYYVWKKSTWSAVAKVGATAILLPLFLIGTAAVFGENQPKKATQIVAETAVGAERENTLTTPIETEDVQGTPPAKTASESEKMEAINPTGAVTQDSTTNKVEPSLDSDPPLIAPAPDLYAVTKVVDGDTFKVSINGKEETIRLIGINTPETVDPRKPVECFGMEASNQAKSLLTGKKVRLEADPSQGELDKYGRLLRYAYLETGVSFNKTMISGGYAYEYTYNTPYKYQLEYKKAQADAQASKHGLWADGACTKVTPQPATQTPTSQPTTSTQQRATTTPEPSSHTFYTSSHYSAKLYYCDTDEGWKSLSSTYLKSFSSAQQLLTTYPNRTLHEECK